MRPAALAEPKAALITSAFRVGEKGNTAMKLGQSKFTAALKSAGDRAGKK